MPSGLRKRIALQKAGSCIMDLETHGGRAAYFKRSTVAVPPNSPKEEDFGLEKDVYIASD